MYCLLISEAYCIDFEIIKKDKAGEQLCPPGTNGLFPRAFKGPGKARDLPVCTSSYAICFCSYAFSFYTLYLLGPQTFDVDMLNAVKSMWADVSSVSPSSELFCVCVYEGLTLETSIAHILFTAFSISTSTFR